ncbi:MAG: hypothetical protein CFE44_02470 [Burkholderiales bacterium PBB4]|nr:MAG: hypothetical protein CFE44_02470 [Burkholderiales bacterium PBB4]
MRETINFIGCGRVGRTLAKLWHDSGHFQIQDILTTSVPSTMDAIAFIGAGTVADRVAAMRHADLWMIATPDAHITASAQQLAARFPAAGAGESSAPLAFHASGALPATALAPLGAQGWQTASAHCILSFAQPHMAVQQFDSTACALEGNAEACAVLRAAFTTIGAQCFEIASADKLLYHAAAVFATNFLPVLQSVAEDLWRKSGVPPALIQNLRAQLLSHAVANITALGPQGALTGPAARGDLSTIARQGAAVGAWSADAGAAYAALSALALQLAKAAPAKHA